MAGDPWLDRWLPLVAGRAGGGPVLEIGCGRGEDTATLLAAGLRVVAFDLSPEAVMHARLRAPAATVTCASVLAPFPLEGEGIGVVVASLSLHYFSWPVTLSLAERIRGTLAPGGVLLCRLNSAEDHHFGATGHPEIEPGYFLVDGEPKRFFDRAAVDALFGAPWRTLAVEHRTTDKYPQPKALWEVVVERGA